MREFAVYDNNGYVLQFGQPVLKRARDTADIDNRDDAQ